MAFNKKLGAVAAAGLMGAAAFAATQGEPHPKYWEGYNLQASLDAFVAPRAASLAGQFEALQQQGETFSVMHDGMRKEVVGRYEEIKGAGRIGGVYDQLDDLYQEGYKSVKSGDVTLEMSTKEGMGLLLLDHRLRTYASQLEKGLQTRGIGKDLAQKVAAGMVSTEYLAGQDVEGQSPAAFIEASPFGDEVKTFLTWSADGAHRFIEAYEERSGLKSAMEAKRAMVDVFDENLMPPVTMETSLRPKARTSQSAEEKPGSIARPVARPDVSARSERVMERARERLLAVTVSKRPVSRKSQASGEVDL